MVEDGKGLLFLEEFPLFRKLQGDLHVPSGACFSSGGLWLNLVG